MDTVHKPLSYRQKRAVDLWIDGGRKSKARALREAGFSNAVVRVPSKVFDSPAVQQELELRGLGRDGLSNDELSVVAEIRNEAPRFDFSTLTTEQCQEIKARLAEVGYAPTGVQPEHTKVQFSTPHSGYLFEGETAQVQGFSNHNMSSM